ncbi:MAG: hypothetical protein ACI4V7_10510 [Succinivibrionaceae bacterium]
MSYYINRNVEQAKINLEMFYLSNKFDSICEEQMMVFVNNYLSITKVQLEHILAANDSKVNEAGNSK